MSEKASASKRPLSPHLLIYRPQMTSVLSILHRMTGFALTIGLLFFIWWLVAAAAGPEAYNTFAWFCGTPLGLLMLAGWSVCLYYHLANGIRHLFWDAGLMLDLKNAILAGYFVLIFTALLTAGTWICVFMLVN